jgi:hypothetical protein
MSSEHPPGSQPGPVPTSAANGTRSVEQLQHFQCGACQKWWTIGDAPPRPNWYCPWCGRENRFG